MKLALVFLLSASGTLIGLALSKRLTRRRRFFEEMISLINALIGDFRFRQSTVAELLESANYPEIKPMLDEFIAYASGKKDKFEFSRGYLTEREYSVINEMFSALGTYDLVTQVFMLDNYKVKIEEFYAAAKEKEKSMGGTVVKLGFLFGLAAGILIL